MPKQECDIYLNKILKALNKNNFVLYNQTPISKVYELGNMQVKINTYENHPKNQQTKEVFPENYTSIDIIIKTKGYKHNEFYERMWNHSMKIFRVPGKRDNPKYIESVDEILNFFPAQVEMGCGPSIEAGIPPLYDLHETYFVQNHITKQFYFAEQDKLILNIINNPSLMAQKFGAVPTLCVKAQDTQSYKIFAQLYDKGYFVGTVYNNNFDRIIKRFGISEFMLRIFEINTYLPKIQFDHNAKSLIVFGSHADRREVQKQAREQGLKVIHIDPEGFIENNGFVPYPIEAPQNDDLIWKVTFSEAMKILSDKLL